MTDCLKMYSWVDTPLYEWIDQPHPEFGECPPGVLHQVWRDNNYAYAVTTSGLEMFDITTSNKVAYIYSEDGFTTIWGNNNFIYFGTSNEGIKYLDKTTISGGDLANNLQYYDHYYNTGSDNIKYLHGYENTVVAVTDEGIDILNMDGQGFKSTTSGTNFTKCFMTSKNEVYYIIQEAETNGIGKINSTKCDWQTPDIFYESGASFLPAELNINDIFVTENTSSEGNKNTLFVATSEGAYVVDEGTDEFDIYYTKEE